MSMEYLSKSGATWLISKIKTALSGKVDKVDGKGLSTNDYTTAEKSKLSGIAAGAEVNQNAFSSVVVGSTTVAADAKTDSLTLVAGANVTLTPDADNDTITATDGIATAENKTTALREAEALYEKLSDGQKAKVTNYHVLLMAQTEAAIGQIGYVSEFSVIATLSKESAIAKAANLYNQLTDEEKQQISNADKLTEAQNLLSTAKTMKQEAQTFAEKLFVDFAKAFKHPESISLQHAWYSTMSGTLHNFTFQFDVKNGLGIVENCYYGTNLPFTELTDEALNQSVSAFRVLGEGYYFAEGVTTAKDSADNGDGIELDAAAIQSYFQRHR